MRIASGVLAVLLLLFALVQYNDPDGPLWAAFYGVAAFWPGLAAWRPQALRHRFVRLAMMATVVAAVAGTIFYWPTEAEWWRISVWWHAETAREGMGFMIIVGSLLVATATGAGRRPANA
jgi:hypothetical protein